MRNLLRTTCSPEFIEKRALLSVTRDTALGDVDVRFSPSAAAELIFVATLRDSE
jgi:hypothetical protein